MPFTGVNAGDARRAARARAGAWRLLVAPLLACATTLGRDVPRDGDNEVRDYLGAPGRAAASDVALDQTPEQAWRADVGRGTLGAVAMGERVTAVTTVDRWVYLIDTRTGQTFWRWRAETPFSTGPLIAGGRVYVGSEGDRGKLTGIDVPSGKRRFNVIVGDVTTPLTYRAGTLYGTTSDGLVFAHATDKGRRLWSRATARTRSGAALAGGWVVVPTLDDSLWVLDAGSGTVRAHTSIGVSSVAPAAVIDDSTVALTSPAGAVVIVAVPSGAVRWRLNTGARIFGSPAVARDTVFALTDRCTLWAIPVTGTPPADTVAVPRCITQAGPALVRHGVLVATVEGDLVYLDRSTGRPLWTRRVGGELRQPPMIRNGQVVAAPVIGDVVSFR